MTSRFARLADGWFDVRAHVLVERAIALATSDELADDDRMEALRDEFIDELERRYARSSPGWRRETERLLRAEWESRLEAVRAARRRLDDLGTDDGGSGFS